MAIKRRRPDGSIELVTFKQEDEDKQTIKRLTALVKELSDVLADLTGFEKPVSDVSSYSCYS